MVCNDYNHLYVCACAYHVFCSLLEYEFVFPITLLILLVSCFSNQVIIQYSLPICHYNRNGLRTIAVGTGAFDRLDLPFLPNNADVRQGDLLVTSGLGGAFPAGYPVAIIDNVTRVPQEPFAAVSARPAAKLNQIREIMLIWPIADEDDPETPE